MGFIENIAQSFGLGEMPIDTQFKAVLMGDSAVYLQNITSIKSYSLDKVELSLKKGGLVVTGSEMFIKKYCMGDLVICGKIKSLSRT